MGDGSVFVEPDLIMPGWAARPADLECDRRCRPRPCHRSPPACRRRAVAVPSVTPAPDVVIADRIPHLTAPPPTFAVPRRAGCAGHRDRAAAARRRRSAASGRRPRHDDGSDRWPPDVRPRTRGDAVGGGADADRACTASGAFARPVHALASRRRRHVRSRTERALRTIGADERLLRVDIAIRAAASQLSDRDRRILAVMVDDQGAVEIVLSASVPDRRAVLVDRRPLASRGDDDHRIAEPGGAAGRRTVCRTRATRRDA